MKMHPSRWYSVPQFVIKEERDRLIQEEQKKLRLLRLLVDLTTSILYQDRDLTLEEAKRMIRITETSILKMFPDKQETFDIVLLPRFQRTLRERWGVGDDPTVY